MKHSIKRQMTVVFSGLIIFILVMMFLVYSKCLETYYIMHKESDLLEVHKTVGTALAQGNKDALIIISQCDSWLRYMPHVIGKLVH